MSYQWRKLSKEQRAELLRYRQLNKLPWHSPPHFQHEGAIHYHLMAACYEHKHHVGHSPERMQQFEAALLDTLLRHPAAWCILPNHYHVLALCEDLKATTALLGELHGRTSFEWNGEENTRGRKVWHRARDRAMRPPAHFWRR